TPHPAVARIVVQEAGGVAYGSGTLIDVREQYGLVVTNWHVVRDAVGKVEVVFPDGFRSEARALKLDSDWDLAALVIWRPPADAAPIANHAPRPGERLTICGYGQGDYRTATGRCTDYYAPKIGLPHELVELDVEARQGDSGGPIFNSRGELAGVLFGAGQGTTLGAFGGRVNSFLSTLASDIGVHARRGQPSLALEPEPANARPPLVAVRPSPLTQPRSVAPKHPSQPASREASPATAAPAWSSTRAPAEPSTESGPTTPWTANTSPPLDLQAAQPPSEPKNAPDWFDAGKSAFALVGVVAVLLAAIRRIA
ncbi:MAG: trypsin-like peptidase domain-containing protein, partial [Planctomycetota bacterium]